MWKLEPLVIMGNHSTNTKTCPTSTQQLGALRLLKRRVQSLLNSSSEQECGEGFWYQLLSVNMSDPTNQCPRGWVEENEGGVRACGRGITGSGCIPTTISARKHRYSKVCGKAIGYQYGHTDAFAFQLSSATIDQVYVDGLSITHGSPRQHIWTYAAGVREGPSYNTRSNCPCSNNPGQRPPHYIGNNWYCESGNPTASTLQGIFSNDPLWDGQDCEGSCCTGKSAPWFTTEIAVPTNDDIEARICSNEHSNTNEDVFIHIFEIYIQ